MEFLKCKACGSIGMVPMDVNLLDEDEDEDAGNHTPEILDYLTRLFSDGDVDDGDPQGEVEGDEIEDEIEDEREGEGEGEGETETEGDDEQSRFYSCHVCGDNWLSIRRFDDLGQSKVTFIHQMGVEPILRRIAHLQAELALSERTVDHWEYYLDDDEVAEGEWLDKLEDRRKVLKAICSN